MAWADRWFDGDSYSHLKVVRYPGRTDSASDQGVGPHKDYGWTTVLLRGRSSRPEDYDGAGLQVEPTAAGELPAPVLP